MAITPGATQHSGWPEKGPSKDRSACVRLHRLMTGLRETVWEIILCTQGQWVHMQREASLLFAALFPTFLRRCSPLVSCLCLEGLNEHLTQGLPCVGQKPVRKRRWRMSDCRVAARSVSVGAVSAACWTTHAQHDEAHRCWWLCVTAGCVTEPAGCVTEPTVVCISSSSSSPSCVHA